MKRNINIACPRRARNDGDWTFSRQASPSPPVCPPACLSFVAPRLSPNAGTPLAVQPLGKTEVTVSDLVRAFPLGPAYHFDVLRPDGFFESVRVSSVRCYSTLLHARALALERVFGFR